MQISDRSVNVRAILGDIPASIGVSYDPIVLRERDSKEPSHTSVL